MVLIDINCIFNMVVATTDYRDYPSYKEYSHEIFGRVFPYIVDIYAKNYERIYGRVVIAIDDRTKKYWRKYIYSLYKFNRLNWFNRTEYNPFLDSMKSMWFDEIENFKSSRFCILEVAGAEADDIISVLSRRDEPHLIISVDKDFKQLISPNISIFNPLKKESINFKKSNEYNLIDHILEGDSSDNIPSIFAYMKPSLTFKNWFEDRYKTKLTEQLYRNLMIISPYVNVLYQLDMRDELNTILSYSDNNGYPYDYYYPKYHKDNKSEQKKHTIKSIPASYIFDMKKKRDITDSYQLDFYLKKDILLSYNYQRNEKLIDMSKIPQNIVEAINYSFDNYKRGSKDIKSFASRYSFAISDLN